MTSLAEVYEGRVGEYASPRRLYLGVGCFTLGALLVVLGIVVAATDVATAGLGWRLGEAREAAGVLAGVGVPATFLGVFAIMPTGRRTQAAAVVGAGVAVLGVALFAHAYPCHWSGANCPGRYADLTLPTVGVYFLGTFTTFWCLFVGVANFKTRNAPGDTVRLEVTREGETEIIEVPQSQVEDVRGATGSVASAGGIGLLGETPDGSVETQTNRGGSADAGTAGRGRARSGSDSGSESSSSPGSASSSASGGSARTSGSPTGSRPDGSTVARRSDASSSRSGAGAGVGTGAASDGGASTNDITPLGDSGSPSTSSPNAPESPSANAGAGGSPRSQSPGDTYCGSCSHFQYVRTENGMQPYCGLHDELMDDMEACDDWSPR